MNRDFYCFVSKIDILTIKGINIRDIATFQRCVLEISTSHRRENIPFYISVSMRRLWNVPLL